MAKLTLEQLQRKMARWGPKGIAMIQDGMEQVGTEVNAHAIRHHLHGPKMPRGVTGGFSNSTLHSRVGMRQRLAVRAKKRGSRVTISVGTNLTNRGYSYPRAHEYGLGKMPERPWLRPSVKAKKKRLLAVIRKRYIEAYNAF